MRLAEFSIIGLTLILAGCAIKPVALQEVITNEIEELSIWPEFSIKSRLKFQERIVRADESLALVTYNTNTAKRQPDDVSVIIFPQLSFSCSKVITGSSQMQLLNSTTDKILWGKVDIWETRKLEGFEDFASVNNVKCRKSELNENEVLFGMCAERNGKSVVVCIEQQTDNSKLAKDIFKTFRWAE